MSDPYTELGVAPNASATAIRKAYRRLVKTCHPDLHPDNPLAAEHFIRLSAAYETLSNTQARRQYDESKAQPERGASAPAQPSQEDIERFYRRYASQMRGGQAESLADSLSSMLLAALKSPVTYCVIVAFILLLFFKAGVDSVTRPVTAAPPASHERLLNR